MKKLIVPLLLATSFTLSSQDTKVCLDADYFDSLILQVHACTEAKTLLDFFVGMDLDAKDPKNESILKAKTELEKSYKTKHCDSVEALVEQLKGEYESDDTDAVPDKKLHL
jgi:hypothetical protein